MKMSFRHLLHMPVKATLFLVLIALSTALLVVGAGLVDMTEKRIRTVDDQFVTLGTVEQTPDFADTSLLFDSCSENAMSATVDGFGELLTLDLFGTMDERLFLQRPQQRPFYLAHIPGLNPYLDGTGVVDDVYVIEFTPLEDINTPESGDVLVKKILYAKTSSHGIYLEELREGEEALLCGHFCKEQSTWKAGKDYIATVVLDYLSGLERGEMEYAVYTAPFSTQVGSSRLPYADHTVHMSNSLFATEEGFLYAEPAAKIAPEMRAPVYAEEVTPGFFEIDGRGEIWMDWIEQLESLGSKDIFTILPTNSLNLLPTYHAGQLIVDNGRKIEAEEFETGAPVCLLPSKFLQQNNLNVGDSVDISLICSLYGSYCSPSAWCSGFSGTYSLLDAKGKPYEDFWMSKYEIVGTYSLIEGDIKLNRSEIKEDMIIIPANSVMASDQDNIAFYAPLNSETTSFIIPNGAIDEFKKHMEDELGHDTQIHVEFFDNGYSSIMNNLRIVRLSALLLFVVSFIAVLVIVILLCWFFVAKQAKRTAVERGMGLTKRQCRVSIMSGLLVLTFAAVILGTGCGAASLSSINIENTSLVQATDDTEYDFAFSAWHLEQANEVEEYNASELVYALIPMAVLALVYIVSTIMLARNLRIEPIYLLSRKGEM